MFGRDDGPEVMRDLWRRVMESVARGESFIDPETGIAFRALDAAEEAEFRAYAREHPPTDDNQRAVAHPVCRDEWAKGGH